jgi:D-amino-acid dehydrogenase
LHQPVLDVERGYVLAPMQRGLGLTTGAEFAPIDAPPTPVQLAKAEALARELVNLGKPFPSRPGWAHAPAPPTCCP